MRTTLAVVLGVLLLLLPRAAAAAMLRSYDVASLAFRAQEIVLVEKVDHWRIESQLRDFERVRVTRSYAGSALHPGDEVTIETSCYGLEPLYGWGDAAPAPKVSDERVFFLRRVEENRWPEPPDSGAPATAWRLEASGMRIFVDGRVHRFVQEMNPGCYGPVPGEGPGGAPYDRRGFESALATAIATATAAHALLAAPVSPARTADLLGLVGAAEGDLARRRQEQRDRDFGVDTIATTILEAFARENDLPALLEGTSRTSRVDLFMSDVDVSADRLGKAALSTALPVRQRVSAVSLLLHARSTDRREPAIAEVLSKLLSDPAPELRLAALRTMFPTPRAFLDAVVARFGVETDARVRYALFVRAKYEGVAARLGIPATAFPIARGLQEDGQASISWAVLEGSAGWSESLTIVLRRDGVVVTRELRAERDPTTSDATETTVHLARLTVPPGVPPGVYDVQVDLVIANDGRRSVPRTIDLGRMDLGPREVSAPVGVPSVGRVASVPRATQARPPAAAARWRAASELPGPRVAVGVILGVVLGLLAVRGLRRRAAGRAGRRP